jgi:hypothetical protein
MKAAALCSVHVFPTFLLLELKENNNELDASTDLRLEVRVYMHHVRLVHLKTNTYIFLYRLICCFLIEKKDRKDLLREVVQVASFWDCKYRCLGVSLFVLCYFTEIQASL